MSLPLSQEGVDDAEEGWRRRLLHELCAVDSTTGHEGRLRPLLDSVLGQMGARVRWQSVGDDGEDGETADEGRANVLATWGRPRVLLSTHLDTVPPYLPPQPTVAGLAGRGSCDAKGQIVAQLSAIRQLLAAGEDRLAWLGVVGEETHSDGARAAQTLVDETAADLEGPGLDGLAAVVVGEPTEGRPVIGQKGFLHLELRCAGRRAHGADAERSHPDRGSSALWALLDWLEALRKQPASEHEVFGSESWNLGLLNGGDAPNVVAGEARAELVVRTVPGSSFVGECRRLAPAGGEVTMLCDEPPSLYGGAELLNSDDVSFGPGTTVAFGPGTTVAFGSDAPHLAPLAAGRVLLFGPGSIATAHTDDESLSWRELAEGTDGLVELCRHLLAVPAPAP